MATGEFDLIRDYFANLGVERADVSLGVGDDGAILNVPHGRQLLSVTDTLVQSVHFPRTCPARSIGHRALAVNLSDIAAMGGEPAWASLSLSVPHNEASWMADFAAGFGELASEHGVQLVGGDTVRGPLVITVHLMGLVNESAAVRRSGASAGDLIYTSGTLGDAAAGLRCITRGQESGWLADQFLYPQPQVNLGRQLGNFCSAAIDISDSFGQDLGHILQASDVGANVHLEKLPLSSELCQHHSIDEARYLAISGGDDYELCMCVPPEQRAGFERFSQDAECLVSLVGEITAKPGLRFLDNGSAATVNVRGHDHFGSDD